MAAGERPVAALRGRPDLAPDGRVIYTQDSDVYIQAAQHGAPKVLLADLPWKVRNVDAKGA